MKLLINILTFWIPVKKVRKNTRTLLYFLQFPILWKDLSSKKTVFVVCYEGMGDYIYLFNFMATFKKTHNITTLIFLARNNHQAQLAKSINAFDKIYTLKPTIIKWMNSYSQYNNEKFLFGNFFQKNIYDNILDKNCTALEGLKYLLNIKKDSPLRHNVPVNYDNKVIYEIQNRLSAFPKNKTVLISTNSNSLSSSLQDDYWLKIADFLSKNGFCIIFNSQNTDFYGYKTIFPTKEELPLYTDYFGFFLGFRSGIVDLIAMYSSAKVMVIYPTIINQNDKKVIVKAFGNYETNVSRTIFNKWSLNKFGLNCYETFDNKLNLKKMLEYMNK